MTQLQDSPAASPITHLDWTAPLEEPATALPPDRTHQQAAVVRTVGQRLREARELCNLSLSAAAKYLGYANASKLSKVERATDTNSVPLWLILQAAKGYEVSVDYLFGLTDDWETGVPRGTQSWLLDAWQKARERDLGLMDRLHCEVAAVATHTAELAEAARELTESVDNYRARNEGFDMSPVSSQLLSRSGRLYWLAVDAETSLAKLSLAKPARRRP